MFENENFCGRCRSSSHSKRAVPLDLVLETSYYTNHQFKAFKNVEAYMQVMSGFVTSVQGAEILNKIVVVAKVRHSQRMNDPLEDICIIAESDGTILSTHC